MCLIQIIAIFLSLIASIPLFETTSLIIYCIYPGYLYNLSIFKSKISWLLYQFCVSNTRHRMWDVVWLAIVPDFYYLNLLDYKQDMASAQSDQSNLMQSDN